MGPIVVVTPNPAIDITYRVDAFRRGETVRVEDAMRRPGGKGVNVARVIAQTGRRVRAVLPLGGDAGRWIDAELTRLGIDATVVPLHGPTRSTVAILEPGSHPTLFSEAGPDVSARELADLGRAISHHLPGAALLVVAGSLPAGITAAAVGVWIRGAREAGVDTLVDASGPALLAAATAGATTVKSNAAELLDATGERSVDAGIHRLLERGADRVVVSLGADGLIASTRREHVVVPAVARVEGNPTGAGDAATAALALALVERQPLEVCARRAAAMGTAAVSSSEAGHVPLDLYARYLDLSATGAARS